MDGMALDDSAMAPDSAGMDFAGAETSEATAQGLVRCTITPRGGDDRVTERSTEVFDCVFSDEAGAPVTPDTFCWSLTDAKGNLINARDRQQIVPPGGSVPVLLTGADLQIMAAEAGSGHAVRKLLVEIAFTSTLGDHLPLNIVKEFLIINLPRIE